MPKSRNIRIFVSSTFKDMQTEREVLMKEVFPKLQQYFRDRNIVITPVSTLYYLIIRLI